MHSGDPSLYGAIGEQNPPAGRVGDRLRHHPGGPRLRCGRAARGQELTLPGISQTVVLTRTNDAQLRDAEPETLETLALSGATLAIHLSARNTRYVEESLIPHYGADCPVAIAVRASWPDELIIRCRLTSCIATIKAGAFAALR